MTGAAMTRTTVTVATLSKVLSDEPHDTTPDTVSNQNKHLSGENDSSSAQSFGFSALQLTGMQADSEHFKRPHIARRMPTDYPVYRTAVSGKVSKLSEQVIIE